jgi:hypothetical protein
MYFSFWRCIILLILEAAFKYQMVKNKTSSVMSGQSRRTVESNGFQASGKMLEAMQQLMLVTSPGKQFRILGRRFQHAEATIMRCDGRRWSRTKTTL